MAGDASPLESRYIDACLEQDLAPNSSILSSIVKVEQQKASRQQSFFEIFIDQFTYHDIPILIDTLSAPSFSDINYVDVYQKSSNVSLHGKHLLSIFSVVFQKLRIVDLIYWSSLKDVLCYICQTGITCKILNLRFSPIRKLKMNGKFLQLHTLNLDFNVQLTGFSIDCFSCMPNLMRLSLCETRVANLWTTTAALSKLQFLSELRFQNYSCCCDTGPCTTFGNAVTTQPNEEVCSNKHHFFPCSGPQSMANPIIFNQHMEHFSTEGTSGYPSSDDSSIATHESLESEEFSNRSDMEFSSHIRGLDNLRETSNDVFVDSDRLESLEKHIASYSSPICFEKYYREYMITSLPNLNVLDNFPIRNLEREQAEVTCKMYFQCIPYSRPCKESVMHILHRREVGNGACAQKPSKVKKLYARESHHSFTRSLSAAKVSSSPWPHLSPVSKLRSSSSDEMKTFRPRQFEYHPVDARLMVFGTLDGELIVINHESQKLVGYLPSVGALHSILGLCWLKKYPSKLIAGSDNGSLQMYDVSHMPSRITDRYCKTDAFIHTFHDFEHCTSVHVNSSDEYFLASGFSEHVALYDIGSGKRLQIFEDLHREHINVVKFAHHSPTIFASASFDRNVKVWDLRQGVSRPCYTACSSKGNVMVCFSPDDHYLLASAIDNEVKQLLAVDGRLNLSFAIASTGSAQNYTRSYYLNGSDYIISGSCEENVIRICCSQTGKRLKDVSLEDKGSKNSMFVQSLRGDPFRAFSLSVLAAYWHPFHKSQIIKINLLQSDGCMDEDTTDKSILTTPSMGG